MFDRVLRFIFSFTVSVGGPLKKKKRTKKCECAVASSAADDCEFTAERCKKKGGLVLSFVTPLSPLLLFIFHVPVQFRYFIPVISFRERSWSVSDLFTSPPSRCCQCIFVISHVPFRYCPPSIFCICSAQVTPHFFFSRGVYLCIFLQKICCGWPQSNRHRQQRNHFA